jgi:CRP-like cAMP-binding protein
MFAFGGRPTTILSNLGKGWCVVVKAIQGATGNRLLERLPKEEQQCLLPDLQRVFLRAGETLYEAQSHIQQIYFPISSIMSAVTVMNDGSAIEVASVGNEGVTGLMAFSLLSVSPHRVFVELAGEAWRIDAAVFKRCADRMDKLRDTIFRYQQALMFQISQCVACNGLHAIVQRCCRWLLTTHDRVEGDELVLTHEFLSYILGVRRASVTQVLQSIRQKGFVNYGRKKITILDRSGLEQLSCECYESVNKQYHRLLG